MVGIILFVVLALIASYNGDNSGIVAIVKIVGGIALFFVVVSIFAYAPWIFILLIIGIFAWATISDYKSAKCIKDINYQQISSSDNNTLINNYIEHTAFQKELQKNTKTPEEVKRNQISEQIKQMQAIQRRRLRLILRLLLYLLLLLLLNPTFPPASKPTSRTSALSHGRRLMTSPASWPTCPLT